VRPSQVLTIYYVITFAIGVLLTIPTALWVAENEVGARGAAIMTLCWNVLFTMILPLVLDWSERTHCKARFVELEEVAATNPELAAAITEQCKKLSLPGLRLAVVDTPTDEVFSYGIWGNNPRLILPDNLLKSGEKTVVMPSIEAELTRFASQDHTTVFLLYTVLQILLQHVLLSIFR